jgi:type I restriction enzyme S subunit
MGRRPASSVSSCLGGSKPLPPGWRWVKLGEVCEIIAGQSPPSSTYRKTPEGLPFFQGKADFGPLHPIPRVWCVKPIKIALAGDILVSVRAPVGPTNVADTTCCIGRGLAALRCGARIERDYLLAALRYIEPTLASMGSGSTFEAISRSDLESLEIPLPPLSEQRRIAGILREQMAAVERARAAARARLEAVKALPAAYLRQVFPQPAQPLPPGWRWVRLGEVADVEMGQSPPGNSYNANGDGYPLLNGPTEFGAIHPTAVQWTTNPTKFAREGDILFCVRGATTGRKNLADRVYCIGRGLAAIRGRPELSDTWFIWHALDVVAAVLLTKASGSTFYNLPGDELAAASIPLPPLSEQRRIAGILLEQMAAVERARAAAEAELEAIEALPAALLRRAFSGEL